MSKTLGRFSLHSDSTLKHQSVQHVFPLNSVIEYLSNSLTTPILPNVHCSFLEHSGAQLSHLVRGMKL